MGGVIGGIMGAEQARSQQMAADTARQLALQEFLRINVPDIASQELNFDIYNTAGDLTPGMEQALQLGPSAMEGVSTDPRLAQAQMAALNQLAQTGQMGMSPAEAAALAQAQQNAAAQAEAKNKQIVDQFARTGMGGSGAQLAAQLSNSQSAAQMLANNANQIAQSAQQNALQAISQAGMLGGQMQQQQFGQQADIAKAKDYINQFNTQNSQNIQQRNVANTNQAAQFNLQNRQNLMNQNTQLRNQQQQHNKGLIQQNFNNQLARAGGATGQYRGIAEGADKNAARTADMWAGIGRGIDTAAGAAYNAYNNSGDEE